MIPLLKTRGVCLIHCEISDRKLTAGIVHTEYSGIISVVDPASGDRYEVEIPDNLESPTYNRTLKCQKLQSELKKPGF